MLRRVELMAMPEITTYLGISKQRVYQLIQAGRFPDPVATLSVGRIWLREDVERFARERQALDE